MVAQAKTMKTETRIEGLEASCVATAAMTRATKVIEARHKGESLRMAPGTHEVDLTVRITGDLVQGPDVEVAGRTTAPSRGFSDRQLLAAILLPLDDIERRRAIRSAVTRIGKAIDAGGKSPALDALLVTIDAESFEAAEKACLSLAATKTGPSTKAGSLSGKPGVSVSGRVGERTVEVAITE